MFVNLISLNLNEFNIVAISRSLLISVSIVFDKPLLLLLSFCPFFSTVACLILKLNTKKKSVF